MYSPEAKSTMEGARAVGAQPSGTQQRVSLQIAQLAYVTRRRGIAD
jgi:hypothetical protein